MSTRNRNQRDVRRGPELVTPARQVDHSDRPVRFKLKEDLTTDDGLADAWLMPWNPEDLQYDDPEETEITVKDSRECDFAGPQDCEGMALRRFTNNGFHYEIVELFWKARFIDFTADADFETSDDSVEVTVVRYYGGGVDPDPESEGVTVYNSREHTTDTYIFEGDEDDWGWAVYDEHNDKYWHKQNECP